MKRAKSVAIVASVLIALVLLPFGTGFFVQNKIKKQVFQWAEQEPYVSVEWINFKRGFWSSTADLMFVIKNPERQSNHVMNQSWAHLLVKSKVIHGPILFAKGEQGPRIALGWSLIDSQVLKAVEHGYPDKGGNFDGYFSLNAIMRTVIKFGGGMNVQIQGNQLGIDMPGYPQFVWQDFKMEFDYTHQFDHQAAVVSLPKFELTKDDYQIAFENLSLSGNWKKTKYDFYEGDSQLDIKKMQCNKESLPLYGVKKFHVSTQQVLDKDLLNVTVALSFDDAVYQEEHYGPLKHKLFINNIRATVLQKLQQQLQLISHSALPVEQQRMQVMMLLPIVPQLITQGASFEIKQFDLKMPEGPLSIEGYARIAKSNQKHSPENLLRLLPKVTAEVNLQLPTELLKKVAVKALRERLNASRLKAIAAGTKSEAKSELSDQEVTTLVKSRLQDWETRGFLVREKERYKISLTFKEGHFLINGKSLETGTEMKINVNTSQAKPSPAPPAVAHMPVATVKNKPLT